MKVLYVALHDPYDIDLASGSDYHYLHALEENGFKTKVIGPFEGQPVLFERLVARIYQRTGKRYPKHTLTTAWQASRATTRVVQDWNPDVVLAIHFSPLVFYHGAAPCIFRTDTTYYGLEKTCMLYGPLALQLAMWQEKRAFKNCAKVITHSEWSRKMLVNVYQMPKTCIEVFPEPSTLPARIVPEKIDILNSKKLKEPLRLLLVGRDYRRKGVDIAIEVVHKLNQSGTRAELTVCGTQGPSDEYVRFVGPYKKSVPEELVKYANLFQQAHLLIHPALFEPAGIAPGEAAAFGTPTITNDTGGLGTTVMDGVSGIVLPKDSPADAYVKGIIHLIGSPQAYYDLCQKTRTRYEQELNWQVAGKRLCEILLKVNEENGAGNDKALLLAQR